MSLGKYKLALKDYEGVFKARPNDKDAKLKFTECKKIVQQIAFQKAISVEETKKSVADSIDLESMACLVVDSIKLFINFAIRNCHFLTYRKFIYLCLSHERILAYHPQFCRQ